MCSPSNVFYNCVERGRGEKDKRILLNFHVPVARCTEGLCGGLLLLLWGFFCLRFALRTG